MQNKLKKVTRNSTIALFGGLIASLAIVVASLSGISETASAQSGAEVNFNLVNGIYIRILDKTATQPIDNIELNTTATKAGVFVSDNFIVDVGTASKTGYNLYVSAGYQTDPEDETTRTTDLVHLENKNYRIATLGADISLADFSDGGNDEAGTSSANRWGLSVDNATFRPLSLDSTEIDGSSEPTASRQTPVYVGLNVNLDSAAGTYKNTLVFSAVGNAVPTEYKVTFASGTTDTVSKMPEDVTLSEVSAQHTFTLPTTVPTRSGYDFTGWKDDASGTVYQAGGEYTVASDEYYEGNAALTAQWMVDPWKSISTMQAMTTTACNNAVVGKTKSLRDTRDSKYYNVKKLADGNCWMTNDLAIVGSRTLTSTNSDVTSSYTLPASTSNVWCADRTAACIEQSLLYQYSSGEVYYNWYTATAGTGKYEMEKYEAAKSSICPKGWRLPKSYNPNEISPLNNYYSVDEIRGSVANWGSSDGYYYYNNLLNEMRIAGSKNTYYFWTANNDTGIYTMAGTTFDFRHYARMVWIYSGDRGPSHISHDKNEGVRVRCIAK